MSTKSNVSKKSYTVNFEIQTFIKVVAVLEMRGISYPAELARLLGIKRQTMHEIWNGMILPLYHAGVFKVKPAPPLWGGPKYYVMLEQNWKEAFLRWIESQISKSKK